jgi:sec-independent protein translocase protein TatB
MFGLSFGELIIIFIVALLVLGPERLPKLARDAGKMIRQFRMATGGVRAAMENEFYKMDQEVRSPVARPKPQGTVSQGGPDLPPGAPAAAAPAAAAPAADVPAAIAPGLADGSLAAMVKAGPRPVEPAPAPAADAAPEAPRATPTKPDGAAS